MYIEIVVIHTF